MIATSGTTKVYGIDSDARRPEAAEATIRLELRHGLSAQEADRRIAKA